MSSQPKPHFLDALKIPDVRYFLASTGFFTLASRATLVVIGFQIYQMTRSPLALGWLGFVEAVPAISLVLFGGYAADHFNRQKILMITRGVSCFCAAALVLLSWQKHEFSLFGLYGVMFLAGIARGFADPASTAFEAQVIPKHLAVTGGSWSSSVWLGCFVLGPAMIGFIYDAWGIVASYLIILLFFVLAWITTGWISKQEQPMPEFSKQKEPMMKSLGKGLHFVFKNQPLLGALTLDLFAVLFGGAIALLPVYAEDILHVGAKGLGLLNAAPSLGAMLITLFATHRPPVAKAGRNLLWTVTGFGVTILIFAFSKNFYLSLAALFFSGVFDGISIVIRRSMIRLLSPEHLRGRVAAASWIFISASNELGAFESGMLAAWIGTVPCVAVGGLLTLGIVALTGFAMPELRRLRFNPETLDLEQ